ncbi:MAG: rhodanese-like domain-containing protein, partial [Caldilineales bacterium]|nr:rhodanese-like domain-containing protein [Caldilineales bacterium]
MGDPPGGPRHARTGRTPGAGRLRRYRRRLSGLTVYTTLVSPDVLAAHLDDPDWAVVDCRFSLQDTEYGRRAYQAGHIPGAVYCLLYTS